MNVVDASKMDKRTLLVASLFDESDEKRYWQTKSPRERLAAVELMRQINYGYNPSTTRLQRVLEVAQRASSCGNQRGQAPFAMESSSS